MTAVLTGRRAFVRISQHPLPVSAFTAHEEANIFSENDINREISAARRELFWRKSLKQL